VTGKSEAKLLFDECGVEFPVVHQDYIGYKNRYTWFAKFQIKLPASQHGKDSFYFEGFYKYDL